MYASRISRVTGSSPRREGLDLRTSDCTTSMNGRRAGSGDGSAFDRKTPSAAANIDPSTSPRAVQSNIGWEPPRKLGVDLPYQPDSCSKIFVGPYANTIAGTVVVVPALCPHLNWLICQQANQAHA